MIARRLAWLLVGLLTLAGAALLALRLLPRLQLHSVGPMVSAFAPYGLFSWTLVALLLLRLKGRRLLVPALLALAAAAVHASWLVPFYVADETPSGGRAVTIASVNLLGGAADPDAVTRATADADVVVLMEFDPKTDRALVERGWYERFPHHIGGPAWGTAGTAVLSRFPIRQVDSRPSGVQIYVTEISPPDGPSFHLVAAHPLNPAGGAVLWRAYGDLVIEAVRHHPDGPLVVIGDFNATPDQFTIRQLVDRAGVRNAADESGAGWLRTWPDRFYGPLPPLFSLDQAFVRGPVYADDIATFDTRGSDHRGVIARLRVAASPPTRPTPGPATASAAAGR